MVAGKAGGFRLEAFKFSVYIALPVTATYLCNDPERVRWMIDYFKYIKYPPSSTSQMDEPLADQINREFKRRAGNREAMTGYREQLRSLDDLEGQRKARAAGLLDEVSGNKGWLSWFGFKK